MSDIDILKKLYDNNETAKVLKVDSEHTEEVKALQNILNELGFGKELKWDKYGADGDYGPATASAVRAFCNSNKIRALGKTVSNKTAERIIYLYGIADDLKTIHDIVQQHNIENRIKKGSRYSTGITALQTLLSELGYNRQLKWRKYGADGDFGPATTAALKRFAADEGYDDDGEALTEKLAGTILNKFKFHYGSEFLRETNQIGDLTETISGRNVIVSDGGLIWSFRKYKEGVYTYGKISPKEFIDSNKTVLEQEGMTDSAINVMLSVAENEGNLDAVNTWDNAFLSFGIFQWTLGTNNNAGELPALLNKLKLKNETIFNKYFGDYGLDISEANDITGYLYLDGIQIKNPNVKEYLRKNDWAYRFWKAGQDTYIDTIEVEHAYSRIKTFYTSDNYMVDNYYISDLIKSEYGVALILDNHVNRPAYVTGCLKKALQKANLPEPAEWTTVDELNLLKEYLKIRVTFGRFPMTDAAGRARVTTKYLNDGIISNERGSFIL